MGIFSKNIFKGYYPKKIKNDKEFYETLEFLYVNKAIELVVAKLLDVEIMEYEEGFALVGESGMAKQSYKFSPNVMGLAQLNYDIASSNMVWNFLMNEVKLKSPNVDIKESSDPQEVTDELLRDFMSYENNGDYYLSRLYSDLFKRGQESFAELRKCSKYNEDRDFVVAAAANTFSLICYNESFIREAGITMSDKLHHLTKKNLKEEISFRGKSRQELVDEIGGSVSGSAGDSFWEYINRIERIKNCPEMW